MRNRFVIRWRIVWRIREAHRIIKAGGTEKQGTTVKLKGGFLQDASEGTAYAGRGSSDMFLKNESLYNIKVKWRKFESIILNYCYRTLVCRPDIETV